MTLILIGYPYTELSKSIDVSISFDNSLRMKTTLDVSEVLLSDAMRITGAKTKKAVVTNALEDLIRRARMKALAEELGDSETFMNSDELESIRLRELSQ